MKRYCKNCGKKLSKCTDGDLCRGCFVDGIRNATIAKWLETGDTGCSVATTLRNSIRDYILSSQDGKCAICGMSAEWNNKPLKFILDHIDGDASNNFQSNLRLICPNCDSQLPTYKSRNKNSARKHRKME